MPWDNNSFFNLAFVYHCILKRKYFTHLSIDRIEVFPFGKKAAEGKSLR